MPKKKLTYSPLKYCCDPFNKHKKRISTALSLVTEKNITDWPDLNLSSRNLNNTYKIATAHYLSLL